MPILNRNLEVQFNPYPIANGQTNGPLLDLVNLTVCGIFVPSTITGGTFRIQVSRDSTTWVDAYLSDGTQASFTLTANTYRALGLFDTAGWRYMRIVAGQAQGQDTPFYLAARQAS